MKTRKLKENEILIKQDSEDQTIYILIDGSLEIKRDGTFIRKVEEGEVIGELAYLGQFKRSADVIASTPCSVLEIPVDVLKNELEALDPWIMCLFQGMAGKIDFLTRLTESLLPPR